VREERQTIKVNNANDVRTISILPEEVAMMTSGNAEWRWMCVVVERPYATPSAWKYREPNKEVAVGPKMKYKENEM
jgi:hypothetical protein